MLFIKYTEVCLTFVIMRVSLTEGYRQGTYVEGHDCHLDYQQTSAAREQRDN